MQSDLPKFLIVFLMLCSSVFAGDRVQLHIETTPRTRGFVLMPSVFPFDRDYLEIVVNGLNHGAYGWVGEDIEADFFSYFDLLHSIDINGDGVSDLSTLIGGQSNPWLEQAIVLENQYLNGGSVDPDPISFENPYLTNILLSLLLGVNLFHVAIRKSYL